MTFYSRKIDSKIVEEIKKEVGNLGHFVRQYLGEPQELIIRGVFRRFIER